MYHGDPHFTGSSPMQAKFTQGSIFRHVSVMTFASTAGLLALFLVDLVDMYWLSLLGIVELAAAIGYAGSILFFTLAMSIGLTIGCSALVSQSVGRNSREQTQRLVANLFTVIVLISTPVAVVVMVCAPWFLQLLGAEGAAASYAESYLTIILPSLPVMTLAMACGGVMRALGQAKASMYLTLVAGGVNAVLDPILIFGLDWGIEGAAAATVIARLAMLAYGLERIMRGFHLLGKPAWSSWPQDAWHFLQTGLPAVLTNLATPIGVAYVTAIMAQFGDAAVAGNAVISKVQPLAFAGLFALSGSIGPIAGQNYGAGNRERVMQTLHASVKFTLAYTLVACAILLILSGFFIDAFNATGEAASLIRAYCYGFSTMFFFFGITFCTNALFNNLRMAHWATIFNFAKATLFTMPFASAGAAMGGPVGILAGVYIGSIIVAAAGYFTAYSKIRALPMPATPNAS